MPLPKIIQIPVGDAAHLQYHFKQIEVSSAEILTLNSAPKVLPINAPGVGYVLIPIMMVVYYHFGTVVYAVNTTIGLYYTGGAKIFDLTYTGSDIITIAADVLTSFNSVPETWLENATLELREPTGDPTTGDGTMTAYLWYINLEL